MSAKARFRIKSFSPERNLRCRDMMKATITFPMNPMKANATSIISGAINMPAGS